MDLVTVGRPVDAVEGVDRARFDLLKAAGQPVVMKGLVADWPSVQAARQSPEALARYIASFDTGQPVTISLLSPEQGGRYFYNADMTGYNFSTMRRTISEAVMWLIGNAGRADAPTAYLQSLPIAEAVPGFAHDNVLPLLDASYGPRIWIGSEVRVQTHFDPSRNIACLVGGQRRFTLFPPDQLPNLYCGPFDAAPGGVPVSMASIEEPDFVRFPRFAEALKTALYADLEPGDALYIPYAWWHHVQSSGPFNVLVNTWWNEGPADAVSPHVAFYAALMALRQLGPQEKAVWKGLLDTYVFGDVAGAAAHLPEHGRGVFGDYTPDIAAKLKAYIVGELKP